MASLVTQLTSEGLPDGTRLLGEQFTILHEIGKGGFGITYLASDNYLGRKVVIKECFPHAICCRRNTEVGARRESDTSNLCRIIRMFFREARRVATMEHPNIIRVQRIFEENKTAYIVLQLVNGPTLLDIIEGKAAKDFSPAEVGDLLFKLLDAVQEVHKYDFLHRDISPDNILIDKWGAPVLIDFGAAREQASGESRELSNLLIVKEGYSPQEFYFAGGKQSNSSDLYALAATFYHLIAGEAPPNSQLRAADIASGFPDPCVPLTGRFEKYDKVLLRSIDQAMQVLPRDRLQSAQIWKKMIKLDNMISKDAHVRPVAKALATTISEVVSETNKVLAEMAVVPTSHIPKQPPAQRTSTLDWIDEFNAETNDRAQEEAGISRNTFTSSRFAEAPKDEKYRSPHGRWLKVMGSLTVFLIILPIIIFALPV